MDCMLCSSSFNAGDMSEGPQAEAIGYKELQTFKKSQMQNLARGIKQSSAMVQTED